MILKGQGGRAKMNSSMGLHINDKLHDHPSAVKVKNLNRNSYDVLKTVGSDEKKMQRANG